MDAKVYNENNYENLPLLNLKTNFDVNRVQTLYSNLSSLSFLELKELRKITGEMVIDDGGMITSLKEICCGKIYDHVDLNENLKPYNYTVPRFVLLTFRDEQVEDTETKQRR